MLNKGLGPGAGGYSCHHCYEDVDDGKRGQIIAPGAALTKCHKLGGSNHRCALSRSSGC